MSDPGDGTERRKGRTTGGGFDLDAELGIVAAAERRSAPEPSEALMARVLADAAEVAGTWERSAAAAEERPEPRRGGMGFWLSGLFEGPRAAAFALTAVFALAMGAGYVDGPGGADLDVAADDEDVATVLAELAVGDLSGEMFF